MYYEREYSQGRFKSIDSKMPWIIRRIAHHFSYARGIYFMGFLMLVLLWSIGSFRW